MQTNKLIAEALTDVFSGDNWTDLNLQDALAEVGYQMAQSKVPFTENTIAKIVYHLKYSNETVLKRAQGFPVQYDNENEGFAAPLLNSEQDWQKLIKETMESAKILAEAVASFPQEKLAEEILPGFSSAYKNFQGVVEHAHYHLGQIVMIKKYLQIL